MPAAEHDGRSRPLGLGLLQLSPALFHELRRAPGRVTRVVEPLSQGGDGTVKIGDQTLQPLAPAVLSTSSARSDRNTSVPRKENVTAAAPPTRARR